MARTVGALSHRNTIFRPSVAPPHTKIRNLSNHPKKPKRFDVLTTRTSLCVVLLCLSPSQLYPIVIHILNFILATMKATTTAASATTQEEDSKVKSMIQACSGGNLHIVQQLLTENSAYYASQQDVETGRSPLMAAAAVGNEALCQHLLEAGAPWNAVDRQGQCAGNYATLQEHWGVVNLLVEWGTRAELILGMVERNNRQQGEERYSKSYDDGGDDDTIGMDVDHSSTTTSSRTVEHEPSTKPFYLRQRLHYTADGQSLLDSDKDAVMMEWERPLMNAHAKILMDGIGKRVMNIGFGMGIIDSALQEFNPDLHIIIEAHPDVYKKMLADGWDKKQNVRICFGKWQDWVPKLLAEEVTVDGIFFDTVSLFSVVYTPSTSCAQ